MIWRLSSRLEPIDTFVLSRRALLSRIGELVADAPLPEVADLINGAQAQMVLWGLHFALGYRILYPGRWRF